MSDHESTQSADNDALNNSSVKMTISDYAKMTGQAESTVRTQVSRRKLESVREVVNNREQILVVTREFSEKRADAPFYSVRNDALFGEKTEALHQVQVQNARLEERLQTLAVKIEGLEAIIESLKIQISDKAETISSQKMANEALNSERLNITGQLQKYREPERKWWNFFGKNQP